MDSALRHYLEAGHTLADAAASAGITYADARQQLLDATDDSDLEIQRMALATHAAKALTTLVDLLEGAEDEKVRLSAAKTLLELQTKHKPKGRRLEIAVTDDLWTMAARGSVNRELVQDVDRGTPAEEITEPLEAAADRHESPSDPQVVQNPELGDVHSFPDLFQFHANHTPTR